jgi:hypothetical protein
MAKTFEDFDVALRMRDLIENIVETSFKSLNPADRTAKVVTINREARTAEVQLSGDEGLLIVKFPPSLQPRTEGSMVRVSGKPGNYFITSVLSEAAVHEVYEVTDQKADEALQLNTDLDVKVDNQGTTLTDKINTEIQNRVDALIAANLAREQGDTANTLAINNAISDYQAEFLNRPLPIRSTANPSGTAVNGQVWEKYDQLASPRKLLGVWIGDGTNWLVRSLDPTYIPILDINSGTANALAVSRLAVTDFNNYVTDPYMQSIEGGWTFSVPNAYIGTFPGPDGIAGTMVLGPNAGSSVISNKWSVKPGEKFQVTHDVLRNANADGQWTVRVNWFNADNSQGDIFTTVSSGLSTNTSSSWDTRTMEVTVPAGMVSAYVRVIRYTAWSTGHYIFDNFYVRRKFGGELVVDGGIKAKQIDVSDLNADGRIVVGQTQVTGLNTALSGKEAVGVAATKVAALQNLWGLPADTTLINGGNIATNTVLARSLILTDTTNLWPDPDFMSLDSYQSRPNISLQPDNAGGAAGVRGMKIAHTNGAWSTLAPIMSRVSCKAGDAFRVSAQCKSSVGITANTVYMTFQWLRGDGSTIYTSYAFAANSAWGTSIVSSMLIAPASSVSVIWYIEATSSAPTGSYFIARPSVVKASNGELIVDGAISGQTITGNTIIGASIQGGSIATASGYGDISITPGNSPSNPAALDFWPIRNGILTSDGSRPGISTWTEQGVSGTGWDGAMLRIQGPMGSGSGTRARLDVYTERRASDGAVNAYLLYHAGFQFNTTGGKHIWYVNGVDKASVEPDGIHSRTTKPSTEQPVYVNNTGLLKLQGSSEKVKTEIQAIPIEVAKRFLEIQGVTYRPTEDYDPDDKIRSRRSGMIAQHLAKFKELEPWVYRDAENEPSGIDYPGIVPVHNVLIQDLYNLIKEGRIERTEILSRLKKLEESHA